jgi:hypothetical protein
LDGNQSRDITKDPDQDSGKMAQEESDAVGAREADGLASQGDEESHEQETKDRPKDEDQLQVMEELHTHLDDPPDCHL